MADAAAPAPGAVADPGSPSGEPQLPQPLPAEGDAADEPQPLPAEGDATDEPQPLPAEGDAADESVLGAAGGGDPAGDAAGLPPPGEEQEAPLAADAAATSGDEASLLRPEGALDPHDPADDLLGPGPPVEADVGEAPLAHSIHAPGVVAGGDEAVASPAHHAVGGDVVGPERTAAPDWQAAAPVIQQFDVPDAHIDYDVAGGGAPSAEQESVDRLQAAMESVLTEIHGRAGLSEERSSELAAWREGFEDHVQQLRRLVAQGAAPAAEGTAEAVCSAIDNRLRLFGALPQEEDNAARAGERDDAEGDEPEAGALTERDVKDMQQLRHRLQSHNTGQPLEEVASAWADPEETSREVEELKRVRRQIRYLFGGMIGSLPDSGGALTVDELIGEDDEVLTAMGPGAVPHLPLGQASAVAGPSGYVSAAPAATEGGPLAAVNALLGPQVRAGQPQHQQPSQRSSPQPPQLPPRPRSGSTETSALTASSSRMTANSHSSKGKEDEERRRERKERKHRKHRRREEDADEERGGADAYPPPMVGKREDGAAGKPVNWAEEVVRASLDPQNQWEFPAAEHGYMGHARAAAGRRGQPSWEQPRQAQAFAPRAEKRGNDIAMRARERAEEVMRTEREQQLSARHAEKDIFGRGPVALAGGGGQMGGGGFGMAHHSAAAAGVPRAW